MSFEFEWKQREYCVCEILNGSPLEALRVAESTSMHALGDEGEETIEAIRHKQ